MKTFISTLFVLALSTSASFAHCGAPSSFKNHNGPYNRGQLRGVHRCVVKADRNNKQKCATVVTPDGKSFCE